MKQRLASLLGALVLLTGAVMIGCKQQTSTPTYKITLQAGENGTVEVSPKLPKDGKVPQYTVLTFTAKPNADYETEWAGAAPDAGDKNKATLTVTANTTVSATFKKRGEAASGDRFHVVLKSAGHGTITAYPALPTNGLVAKDTVLTFTATPDFGYEVAGWTGAAQDSADKNKATLKVSAHTTVGVTLKEKPVDASLLQIDSDGTLTGVKDKNAVVGSLTIPKTVTKIGESALAGCSRLMSVTMPDSVTEISDRAFYHCSGLAHVTIGSKVTFIGGNAFQDCISLQSVTIPDSVTTIRSEAFTDCTGLASVKIGAGVTSISAEAFKGCVGLVAITVAPENEQYCSDKNIVYTKDKKTLVFVPKNTAGSFTMPESVTKIGDYAFEGCTGLTAITIPASVTAIESSAFSGCTGLSAITLPDSVQSLGWNSTFAGCTNLTSLTIGSGLTSLGYNAFRGCLKLKTIEVADANTAYCSVDNIIYKKDKKEIIFVPKGLTGAITLPTELTKIPSSAFDSCTGLTSVVIGASVTEIAGWAFSGCTNLAAVTIKSTSLTIGNYAFNNIKSDAQFTVKNQTVKDKLKDNGIPEANITVNPAL
ncbi:leucine-rich repeat protein [Treponema sp.]|uniref:leucine-rich repeat domain-containing protein n=1 Tax=Treponema sp. TaxID=166 RepID=UPI003FA3290F